MKTLEINKILIDENNKKLKIPLDGFDDVRSVNTAFLSVETNNKESNSSNIIYRYFTDDLKFGWDEIDIVSKRDKKTLIKLELSKEIQNAIDNHAEYLELEFESDEFEFVDNEDNILSITYIPFSEYQSDIVYGLEVGKSSSGYVNLKTGELSLKTPLFNAQNGALPLSMQFYYNSFDNGRTDKYGFSNNMGLNLNQILIAKNEKEKTLFEYIDGNGKRQVINEKYYYLNEEDKEIYVNKSKVSVGLDGKFSYHFGERTNNIRFYKGDMADENTYFKLSDYNSISTITEILYKYSKNESKTKNLFLKINGVDSNYKLSSIDVFSEERGDNNDIGDGGMTTLSLGSTLVYKYYFAKIVTLVFNNGENEITVIIDCDPVAENNSFFDGGMIPLGGMEGDYMSPCNYYKIIFTEKPADIFDEFEISFETEYNYEILKKLEAPSGLKLVTSLKDFKGSNLLDYEPEELINVKNNLQQVEESINNLKENIKSNNVQLSILSMSKETFDKQFQVQNSQININEKYLELLSKVQLLNKKNSVFVRGFVHPVDNNKKAYACNYMSNPGDSNGTRFFTEDIINQLLDYYNEGKNIVNQKSEKLEPQDVQVVSLTLANEAGNLLSIGFKLSENSSEEFPGTLSTQKESNTMNKEIYQTTIDKSGFNDLYNKAYNVYFQNEYPNINEEEKASIIDEIKVTESEISDIYSAFSKERELVLALKDEASIDLQICNLIKSNKQNKENLEKYNDQLKKLQYQKEIIEEQSPVYYLVDKNNIYYGFAKQLNDSNETNVIYRLVNIFDDYENVYFIEYESNQGNKIKSISNEDLTLFNFEYDGDLLKSIVDSNGKSIEFQCNRHVKIDTLKLSDGKKIYFNYNTNLSEIFDDSGFGFSFVYENNKVKTVSPFSLLSEIREGALKYKVNSSIDSVENFSEYYIEKGTLTFDYIDQTTTQVSNEANKSLVYVFGNDGSLENVYEKNYIDEGKESFTSKVKLYEKHQDKKVRIISELPYSDNYLSDVSFDNNSIETKYSTYLGETECGLSSIPYEIKDYQRTHLIENWSELNAKPTISMSEENINKLNTVISQNTKFKKNVFVISGWAKAISKFVCDKYTSSMPSDLNYRKFGLTVKVKYSDNSTETFTQTYNWRNQNWQYCAVVVELQNKSISECTCTLEFDNNTDKIEFSDLICKKGDYLEFTYDDENRIVEEKSAYSKFVVSYEYKEDSQNLLTKTIEDLYSENEKKYITKYEYNGDDKLIRIIDSNNLVKENIYNKDGMIVKKLTYNKKEPTNIIFEENVLDDKGKIVKSLNEFGDELCTNNYIDNTNLIVNQVDANGDTTSFGYDFSDRLIERAVSVEGVKNANTYTYLYDFLVKLNHNDFDIVYDYDHLGRLKRMLIEDEVLIKNYLKYEDFVNDTDVIDEPTNDDSFDFDVEVSEKPLVGEGDTPTLQAVNPYNVEEVILGNGATFYNVYNDERKITHIYYVNDSNAKELILENFYDTNGNLIKTVEKDEETKFYYDDFGNLINKVMKQHNQNVNVENLFSITNQVTQSKISIGDDAQTYQYNYSDSFEENIVGVTLPNNITQQITYDALNRRANTKTNFLSTKYDYLTKGNHTSNIPCILEIGVDGKQASRLSYKYDDKGNIIEVRENNNLLARYKYDALSRLIREDNKELSKTTTYFYDAGGNITSRKEYDFTLISNLDDQECASVKNYTYFTTGNRDKLARYDGKEFAYDGSGNPETYKGLSMSWKFGRQLANYNGITYTYNTSGIRTSKTVLGVTTKFFLEGTKIIRQEDTNGNILDFYYGVDGILGFHLKNNEIDDDFYYKKNLQGDILGIFDKNRQEITKYSYDAWGKVVVKAKNISYNNTSLTYIDIANINPFRYRGYYYDAESSFYYLNSRYYDPEICRFINADDISVLSEGKEFINGLNLFSYCNNNPIMNMDDSGYAWWDWLIAAVVAVVVVAATVAVTVATGGIGATMLIGAAVGAGIGGASSAISQLSSGNGFNVGQFLLDMAFGAITGLIGGSALGAVGSAIAMGATGFAQSIATDLVTTGSVDYGKAAVNGVVSGLLGAQRGAQNGLTSNVKALKNSLKDIKIGISQGMYSLRGGNGAVSLVSYYLNRAKNILTLASLNNLAFNILSSNPAKDQLLNGLLNSLF